MSSNNGNRCHHAIFWTVKTVTTTFDYTLLFSFFLYDANEKLPNRNKDYTYLLTYLLNGAESFLRS